MKRYTVAYLTLLTATVAAAMPGEVHSASKFQCCTSFFPNFKIEVDETFLRQWCACPTRLESFCPTKLVGCLDHTYKVTGRTDGPLQRDNAICYILPASVILWHKSTHSIVVRSTKCTFDRSGMMMSLARCTLHMVAACCVASLTAHFVGMVAHTCPPARTASALALLQQTFPAVVALLLLLGIPAPPPQQPPCTMQVNALHDSCHSIILTLSGNKVKKQHRLQSSF